MKDQNIPSIVLGLNQIVRRKIMKFDKSLGKPLNKHINLETKDTKKEKKWKMYSKFINS